MHSWAGSWDPAVLLAVIVLAGVGTAVLFLASVVAYRRRRTTEYLLIGVAIGALLFRSVIGLGTVLGHVTTPAHHLVEHTLDFVIAALVLYAAYAGGSPGSEVD